MPQAGAGSWRSRGIISLYGKGSLHKDLLEATLRTRHRADRRNCCEGGRQRVLTKWLDRHQKAESSTMERELARARREAEEKEALIEVLKSFSGDKLHTMRHGFRPELVTPTPENIQRCRMERRVLQRGFSVGTLYPEVLKALQERKETKNQRRFQDAQLKDASQLSDFEIDRRIADETMKHERQTEQQQYEPNNSLLRFDFNSSQPLSDKVTRPKPQACERSTPLPPIRRDTNFSDLEITGGNPAANQKSQPTEERNFLPQSVAKKPLPPIATELHVPATNETSVELIID